MSVNSINVAIFLLAALVGVWDVECMFLRRTKPCVSDDDCLLGQICDHRSGGGGGNNLVFGSHRPSLDLDGAKDGGYKMFGKFRQRTRRGLAQPYFDPSFLEQVKRLAGVYRGNTDIFTGGGGSYGADDMSRGEFVGRCVAIDTDGDESDEGNNVEENSDKKKAM